MTQCLGSCTCNVVCVHYLNNCQLVDGHVDCHSLKTALSMMTGVKLCLQTPNSLAIPVSHLHNAEMSCLFHCQKYRCQMQKDILT